MNLNMILYFKWVFWVFEFKLNIIQVVWNIFQKFCVLRLFNDFFCDGYCVKFYGNNDKRVFQVRKIRKIMIMQYNKSFNRIICNVLWGLYGVEEE